MAIKEVKDLGEIDFSPEYMPDNYDELIDLLIEYNVPVEIKVWRRNESVVIRKFDKVYRRFYVVRVGSVDGFMIEQKYLRVLYIPSFDVLLKYIKRKQETVEMDESMLNDDEVMGDGFD